MGSYLVNKCHCDRIQAFCYNSFLLLLMRDFWVRLLNVIVPIAPVLVGVLTVETFIRLGSSVDIHVVS